MGIISMCMWTSTCSRACNFRMTTTGVTSVISRAAVHSGGNGTHTCTASRGGDSASDSIVFNVVGEWLLLRLTVYACMYLLIFFTSRSAHSARTAGPKNCFTFSASVCLYIYLRWPLSRAQYITP